METRKVKNKNCIHLIFLKCSKQFVTQILIVLTFIEKEITYCMHKLCNSIFQKKGSRKGVKFVKLDQLSKHIWLPAKLHSESVCRLW